MKESAFTNENFLLQTPLAQQLYHEVAKPLPIIDFHNHLSVSDLLTNRRFNNLAELWLLNDPYKHRAMRICGVCERYITGEASDYEKFEEWCRIFPHLTGNPLQHWSQLELSRVFGIELAINSKNAHEIWERANACLGQKGWFAQDYLDQFRVEYAAPCRMLTESTEEFCYNERLAPSLRGDGILPLTQKLIAELELSADVTIASLEDLAMAFSKCLEKFHRSGCRFSDHALDDGFCYRRDDGKNGRRFSKLLSGGTLDLEENLCLSSHVLRMLGKEYAERGWVMQLHIGALRSTSSRLREIAGPAGGFAGIGRCAVPEVVNFLDDLEQSGSLPRTMLFTLNPSDNAQLSVLSGSFSEDGIAGKVQQGAAWWWCDHIGGIRGVLDTISEYGVLSVFMGMTTDSRSLLSFSRHEYFRRVLCGWIAEKVQQEIFPNDYETLAELVRKVCYQNLKNILSEGEK